MTEIDFYTHAEDRLRVACQLIQKARTRNLRVLVLLPDDRALQALDERLWSFHPHSFLAHCREDEPHAPQTPVLLSCQEGTPLHEDLLLNLRHETPQHFSRFARLLEIVGLEDEDRARARERFRFYRDRGYALRTHPLGQTGVTGEGGTS